MPAQILFNVYTANAEAVLYVPNTLKIPANMSGNKGANPVVGPVGSGNGEAYPWPPASDMAVLPSSYPKAQWLRSAGIS